MFFATELVMLDMQKCTKEELILKFGKCSILISDDCVKKELKYLELWERRILN